MLVFLFEISKKVGFLSTTVYVFMINHTKVVVSVLITKSGDRMRFGCQIWGPKDEVNYVNYHGILDCTEKSAKRKK